MLFQRSAEENPRAADTPGDGGDEAREFAGAIRSAGLSVPAAIVLRALEPLHWIGAQLAWVAQPLVGSLGLRGSSVAAVARLLEGEEGAHTLLRHLEEPREQPAATGEETHARKAQG